MMGKDVIKDETQIIFLAMFWGGGGPYTISQVIHVYDWINRDIPSREDLEVAFNTLLSLDFISLKDDKFTIQRKIGNDFDEFRKKKRINKFKTARLYFEQYPLPTDIPNVISISQERYAEEYAKYSKAFES